jgi:LysR family transcriptional activator of nhaA
MLNYRHLHYFWVVTKEGGFARAAERLDMAVQTISAQVRELEKALGHQLLKPSGRGVALTEAGQAAFARAEEIFQLGQGIPDEVREAASGKVARLAVGLSDGISKLAAHALLEPVLSTRQPAARVPRRRVRAAAGRTGAASPGPGAGRPGGAAQPEPAPHQRAARRFTGRVVRTGQAGRQDRARPLSTKPERPACAAAHGALRPAPTLDHWFETQGLRPRIVGEFEDSALLAVFAARGLGVFPVSRLGADDVGLMRGLRLLGSSDGVKEEIHAIRSRRGQHHPLVMQVVAAAMPLNAS